MKNIIIYSAILLIILLSGCNEENNLPPAPPAPPVPPVGNYIGEFTYDNPSSWGLQTIYYKIEDSKEGYFFISRVNYIGDIIAGDTVYKKTNERLEGRIPSNYPNSPYYITGELEKNDLKQKYVIKGTFTQTIYQEGGPYLLNGSFEIKN